MIKLNNFHEIKAGIKYKSIIDKFSKDAVNGLKRSSPKGNRRTNTYAMGWTIKADDSRRSGYGVVVWNATNYQLTHLLENGHIIANKKGGVGWASARPHIDKVYQGFKPAFIRAMENAKINIEIK